MAAAGTIHGLRPDAFPSISTAGLAKIATARNVMPHRPISDAVCASAKGSDSAWPSAFQGNPVSKCPRSHSLTVRLTASANIREAPLVQISRASAKPSAV